MALNIDESKVNEIIGQDNQTDNSNEPVTQENLPDGSPAPRQPVSLKDDDLVEITWNGQKVQKTYKEAKDGWQRQEDYTRSKQALAEKVREMGTLYEGLTARQQAIAEKEAALDAVLGRTPKRQDAEVDPESVMTVKEAKEYWERQKQELKGEFQRTLSEQAALTNQQQTFERWEEKVVDRVSALQKEHSTLARIPHLVPVLKKLAFEDRPTSEAEMLTAIVKAGKKLAEDLEAEYAERTKRDAVKRKQLKENSPDVVKNSRVPFEAPKKAYGQNRTVKWDDLEKDIVSALAQLDDE